MNIGNIVEYIPVFLTMFIIVDPPGVSMSYLGLAHGAGLGQRGRRLVALKGPGIAFVVLSLFIFLGRQLINALGIQPGSLFIAGGILLFFVATDLLFAHPRRTTATETDNERDHDDIAIFPIALPLIAGPGAITAILIFSSDNQGSLAFSFVMLLIVALVLVITSLMMLGADMISKILGKVGVNVIGRIMGILLAGMSVQFVYNGLVRLGVL